MKKKQNWKIILGILIAVLSLSMTAFAEDNQYQAGTLVQTIQESKLYEQPDAASAELMTVETGKTFFTSADQQNEWIKVKIGDVEGYIFVSAIKLFQAEGIEEEFEDKQNAFDLTFREIEYNSHMKQQKIVWGITIGALVAAIFAVGIVSTVLNNKKTKEKSKQEKGNADEADHTDSVL